MAAKYIHEIDKCIVSITTQNVRASGNSQTST